MLVAAQRCSRADRGLAFARSRLLTATLGRQPDRSTMPTGLAQKKLREARFFLGQLMSRENTSRLDGQEEFGYCVSAFLSAAGSVQDMLSIEHQAAFRPTREAWLASLDEDVRLIVDFMFHQRNRAVHQGDAPAAQVVEHVPAIKAMLRESPSRTARVIVPWMFDEGATSGVATYTLDIAGRQLPASSVCSRFVVALEDLVGRFGG